MKAAFHYVVRSKLIRFNENNEIDFLELEEKFEYDSPIIARGQAFDRYQSFIEVLLESKNKKYTNDREARKELKSFYDPEIDSKIVMGGQEVDFRGGWRFGIGIFMVEDQPSQVSFSNSVMEYYIHGIGDVGGYLDIDDDYLVIVLEIELKSYRDHNYETAGKEIEIVYCSKVAWEDEKYRPFEPALYCILETPYDWDGYDKPYWWGDPDEEEIKEPEQFPIAYENLIASGENHQVEFKSALVYNFSSGRGGIGIKGIVAKAICAFLNSKGGFLFIGVGDDGKIQGLDHDFNLADKKNAKDFFRLEYDQMLEHFLSFSVKDNVTGDFYEVEGKEIFVVTVAPSKRRPIFLKGQDGKEFYVRGEASSRKITDMEELTNYCLDRFTNQ